MKLEVDTMKPAINRLKRAQGQLNAVIRMLEEGSDCRAVVTQLSAASKAIDRAGFSIIASGLEECLKGDDPTADRADMESSSSPWRNPRLTQGLAHACSHS